MTSFHRTGHLVKSEVQRALLVRFLCHCAAFISVFVAIVVGLHVIFGDPGDSFGTIITAVWKRYALIVIVAVALVPCMLLDFIRLTHRIAGPMVRFRKDLHRAAQGETVAPIKFRQVDYWQDIATDFNLLLSRISQDSKGVDRQPVASNQVESEAAPATELYEPAVVG